MPRRSSPTRSDDAAGIVPPQPTEIEDLEKQDFWARHANLTEEEKKVSTIYVYRLLPPIAKEGEDSNIDMIPSHLFDRDLLVSKHGGGKFQFYHNSKLEGPKYNFKRVVSIPGIPAKIYPNHILVDEKGNSLPTVAAPGSAGAPEAPATKDDVRAIIRETAAAAKTGNDAAQEALKSGITLVTTGATEALKIVANAKGSGESSPDVAALRSEISELRAALFDRERQQLQQQIVELKTKIDSPASHRGEVESLSESAKVLGVEGGVLGLLKAVLGGGAAKEDTVWEYGGKKVADAVASFITENGPALTAWLRERTHVQHLEVITKRQQSGMADTPSAPAPPTVQRPAPQQRTLQPNPVPTPVETPVQTETQSQGDTPGEMTGEQMFEMLKQQIPATIRYYWDRDFSGGATAEVVKGNFKPWLPLIRLQFADLDKVIDLAKTDPQLAALTEDPRFHEWAREFFDEFHKLEPDETPAPAAE